MTNFRIVDADCHILEPPDIWKNWLGSQWQDKAPKLVKDPEGGDAWLTAVGGDPDPIGLVSTPGMPFDKFRWFGVTYEEARAGCYNGEERLKDMDIDGVAAEILFPPQRTMSHFLGDEDEDFVLAGVEAYNNFLFEEFCAADPKRLIGMAQIPSLGLERAVDGVRKAKARGAKGVLISNWPAGGETLSRDDDPFLSFIVPVPARYVISPHLMAKSLLRPVLELVEGNVVTQRASLIMPEFLRGDSIAAPVMSG